MANVPKKIILDTDMLTDCDDAGALGMLHVLSDLKKTEILGVVLNGHDTNKKHSAVVSAINFHFARKEIPIGVSGRTSTQTPSKPSSYSNQIFDEYDHDRLTDPEREDAAHLYARLLSEQADNSVTIISIGFLSNLEDLLRLKEGPELVRSKVREISIMGGNYPSGEEYNFNFGGTESATKFVITNWPESVPMTFTGFDIGEKIVTGKRFQDTPHSPMRRAYELAYDSINIGRPSWDQLALLYGACGLEYNGKKIFSLKHGNNQINSDGSNVWSDDNKSRHAYLELATSPTNVETIVEDLMIRQPQ